ncbi:MAG: hypothetical protein HQL32_18005, partial [Planctomycetes bacterium]|nr:hypothetical protein [Planctomycetota bacterium]
SCLSCARFLAKKYRESRSQVESMARSSSGAPSPSLSTPPPSSSSAALPASASSNEVSHKRQAPKNNTHHGLGAGPISEADPEFGYLTPADMGFAAGSPGELRDIPEHALRSAGLGAGFYLSVGEALGGEQSIKVVSETPRTFILSFLSDQGKLLYEVSLSTFPEYIDLHKIAGYTSISLVETTP